MGVLDETHRVSAVHPPAGEHYGKTQQDMQVVLGVADHMKEGLPNEQDLGGCKAGQTREEGVRVFCQQRGRCQGCSYKAPGSLLFACLRPSNAAGRLAA